MEREELKGKTAGYVGCDWRGQRMSHQHTISNGGQGGIDIYLEGYMELMHEGGRRSWTKQTPKRNEREKTR